MKTRSLGDGIEIHQWYPIIVWYPKIHQTIPYKTWDSSRVFCLSHHPDLDQNHEEKNSARRGAKEEWPEQGLEATGGHQQQPHFKGFQLAKCGAKTSESTTPENNTEWCIHLQYIYIYIHIKRHVYICIYIYIYIYILRGYMPEALALPLIWGSGFGALGPPRLWEEAPPNP